MRFEIQKETAMYIRIGVIAAVYLIVSALLGADLFVAVISGLLMCAVLSIRLVFKEKTNRLFVLPVYLITSVLIFLYMQYIISAGISWMKFHMIVINVVFMFALQFLMFAICGNVKASILTVLSISSILGLIDNLVVQSRSREICFSDIWSISTGMSVAAGYSFTLPRVTLNAIALLVPFVVLICRTGFWHYIGARIRLSAALSSSAIGTAVVLLVSTSWGISTIGFREQYWRYHASAFNGFYLNIIHTASATRVTVPSGYSLGGLNILLDEYRNPNSTTTVPPKTDSPITNPSHTDPDNKTEPTSPTTGGSTTPDSSEDKKKPNIIVIMDETFSDLQSISKWMIANGYKAEELSTDVEVLPFWNSLSSESPNVEKGWAISSVYGGNTANSEFEFLTGNTMAFLPANTVPYNLYLNKDNAFSVVDLLNDEGYFTLGMHPEDKSNWSREKIYSYYGFDKTMFIDDFEHLTDDDYYRTHVSDKAVFDEIIRQYEGREDDAPFFTFAITMANHGGYATGGFEPTVHVNGHENYSALQEYLSSIHESDRAIEGLIEYFENVDEETVIVIFGDHQPNIADYIYPMFFGIGDNTQSEEWQTRYTVPYLIWANYEFESDDSRITSINYLSGKMLEVAGIEKTDYLEFIANLRERYPAITAAGYWDAEGVFHNLNGQHAPASENMLLLYEYLEYNALFDKPENKLTNWFRRERETESTAVTAPVTAG